MDAAHYPQILESVGQHGLILPVYLWRGGILDGRLRQMAALESGKKVRFQKLRTESEAAALLWTLHPERAYAHFAAELPLLEACKRLCARPRDLAPLIRAATPPKPAPYRRPVHKTEMRIRVPEHQKRTMYFLKNNWRCSEQEIVSAALELALADEDALRAAIQRARQVIRRRK